MLRSATGQEGGVRKNERLDDIYTSEVEGEEPFIGDKKEEPNMGPNLVEVGEKSNGEIIGKACGEPSAGWDLSCPSGNRNPRRRKSRKTFSNLVQVCSREGLTGGRVCWEEKWFGKDNQKKGNEGRACLHGNC